MLKKEFSEIEKDFRANIGLALISILKKDPKPRFPPLKGVSISSLRWLQVSMSSYL